VSDVNLTSLTTTSTGYANTYETLTTVSPSAVLETDTAWVFWAKVLKPYPVLILATNYAYPEIPLNQGTVVTFLMTADLPTGAWLAYVDFHPTFPVMTNGSWGITQGQVLDNVWYSLQFNGSYWELLNPSTPVAAAPNPLPPPEPLPAVTAPMNVTMLTQGYVLPPGGTAYGTFQNSSNISLNISTDTVSQAVGLYQVVISASASGNYMYVAAQSASGVLCQQSAYTQEFTISTGSGLIDGQFYPGPSPQLGLGSFIPPAVTSGVFSIRRLI
jgi:hypothetical protein